MLGLNTEDIIRLAREAGWGFNNSRDSEFVKAQLKFANLVAAAEREACAKLVSKLGDDEDDGALFRVLKDAAIAIRARGQE